MAQLHERLPIPAINLSTIVLMLVAGIVATVAFDLLGQQIAPALGLASLAPAPLATQSLQAIFGPIDNAEFAGKIVHYLTGIVFYPIGYVWLARPVARAVMPNAHWILISIAYGVLLWVFALYVMAHVVAGNPAFLGFTQITYVALVGHVVYAVILGAVLSRKAM